MAEKFSREINFDNVPNFRDLGGLRARGGCKVAERRVFRSSEFSYMTRNDFNRLTGEIGLASVIDLRSAEERERAGIGLLSETSIKFHNISFLTDGGNKKADEKRYTEFPGMGEFYIYLTGNKRFGQRIVEALEVIAAPENHPLVFHCAVGKDRTGLLAAFLLSALGVADKDIIADYAMSGPPMQLIIKRLNSKPETAGFVTRIPAYFWDAMPESMALLLNALKKEYGSVEGYLKTNGADASLVKRLEKALLD
jgi:protein tyrosine/serine phosphatase